MDIPRDQSIKLRKYFINADPFLWGVLATKNKKDRIKELKQMGLLDIYAEGGNPIYTKINRDLLIEIGITGVLEQIVIPRIVTIFNADTLRYFQDCWDQGQVPSMKYLENNGLYRNRIIKGKNASNNLDLSPKQPLLSYRDPAFIFVQIDTQHNFIERWTMFAGLWFEEISQYIDQAGSEKFNRLLYSQGTGVVDEKGIDVRKLKDKRR